MKNIFQTSKINSMKLKNRMYMAPMGTQTNPDGSFSDRSIRYYEERAKGGFGLIITGANQVTTKYEAKACNILDTPQSFEQLNFLARRIHNYNSRLCVQLTPGLGRMQFTTGDVRPFSASAVDSFWFPEIKCQEFTKEDIQFLIKKMGEGAAKAKAAGVDAVELHGYGGYLMDQFQSELWNKRTDEYGGSLENRMRFSVECVKAIREAVGPNYPILFKFTPVHGVEGGREIEEGIAMANILEDAGVDALHVDVGCYEAWYKAINTVYEAPRTQLDVAYEIKKNVSIPVMSQGKMQNPEDTIFALENDMADYIGLGHMAISDPYWVNKVRNNTPDDIRPCIGCNECLYAGFTGKILHCAVNPQAFQEDYSPLTKADEKKKVLVVGAGPGGMVAAITAKKRGHDVDLWEKRNVMGGLLRAAGGPKFKLDVEHYRRYLIDQVYKVGVNVSLLKEANEENILSGGYDKVIFATGADPRIPKIDGIDEDFVVGANPILMNEKDYGKNVVILGGGLVGCETACHVAEKADSVTIIETLPEILMTVQHSKNNDQSLRQLMEDLSIDVVTGATVTKFADNQVTYEKDGKDYTISADTVAIAAGYISNESLFNQLDEKIDCDIIGDAIVPDNILKAVHQGYNMARVL